MNANDGIMTARHGRYEFVVESTEDGRHYYVQDFVEQCVIHPVYRRDFRIYELETYGRTLRAWTLGELLDKWETVNQTDPHAGIIS